MNPRNVILAACTVFLAGLGLYVGTLSPVFQGDDSPETTAACVTLGIQHPPGYPLQTLAGRVASLCPLGNPGWRVNLAAAAWGAMALGVLFLALVRLLGREDGS